MADQKTIIALNGSATQSSSNLSILRHIASQIEHQADLTIWEDLSSIPHFDTALSNENTPEIVGQLRNDIAKAHAVIICTPEYVFSIPSRLKNVIEWCVSTVIFTDKPTALITASANGLKGHEELQLLMETLGASLSHETSLLIQGVKGKVDKGGLITDDRTRKNIDVLCKNLLDKIKT